MKEQDIQRAVFEHIRVRGVPNVFAWHTPNGGYRRKGEARILKGIGVKAGVPDVLAIKDGRSFALELKAPDGKLVPHQKEVLSAMESAGATVAVAYGLEAALKQLETWGLLKGVMR